MLELVAKNDKIYKKGKRKNTVNLNGDTVKENSKFGNS